jgi:hypothetical protein
MTLVFKVMLRWKNVSIDLHYVWIFLEKMAGPRDPQDLQRRHI